MTVSKKHLNSLRAKGVAPRSPAFKAMEVTEETLFDVFMTWKRAYLPTHETFKEKYPPAMAPAPSNIPEHLAAPGKAVAARMDVLRHNKDSRPALVSAVAYLLVYGEALERDGFTLNKEAVLALPDDLRELVQEAVDAAIVHGS